MHTQDDTRGSNASGLPRNTRQPRHHAKQVGPKEVHTPFSERALLEPFFEMSSRV